MAGSRGHRQECLCYLGLGEVGVALNEFFCAAAGEAHGDAAILFVAFYTNYCAYAVFGVADFAAEHGVGWSAA